MDGDHALDWSTKQTPQPHLRKDFNTIMVSVLWVIRKHRNAIVFDVATSSVASVIARIQEEGKCWHLAELLRGDLDSFFAELYPGVCVSNH
jgi:hypothetical protein